MEGRRIRKREKFYHVTERYKKTEARSPVSRQTYLNSNRRKAKDPK